MTIEYKMGRAREGGGCGDCLQILQKKYLLENCRVRSFIYIYLFYFAYFMTINFFNEMWC
jgi:hypothetical protein